MVITCALKIICKNYFEQEKNTLDPRSLWDKPLKELWGREWHWTRNLNKEERGKKESLIVLYSSADENRFSPSTIVLWLLFSSSYTESVMKTEIWFLIAY